VRTSKCLDRTEQLVFVRFLSREKHLLADARVSSLRTLRLSCGPSAADGGLISRRRRMKIGLSRGFRSNDVSRWLEGAAMGQSTRFVAVAGRKNTRPCQIRVSARAVSQPTSLAQGCLTSQSAAGRPQFEMLLVRRGVFRCLAPRSQGSPGHVQGWPFPALTISRGHLRDYEA
jgi:hypothetical protein